MEPEGPAFLQGTAGFPDISDGSQVRSHGGCRATAYAFHGRFDAPDPFDLELNDGIDLTTLPE